MTKTYIKKVSFKLLLEGVEVRCGTHCHAVQKEVDSYSVRTTHSLTAAAGVPVWASIDS